ncbi:hypothetical protein BGZ67_003525 [Mortierella alpina]|nr:hypothetical protein BGZ67_003525 [Mortierella alpina]
MGVTEPTACQLRSRFKHHSARHNDSGSNITSSGNYHYDDNNIDYNSNICPSKYNYDRARDHYDHYHRPYHYGHHYDRDNDYCHYHYLHHDYYHHDYYEFADRLTFHLAPPDQNVRFGPSRQFKTKIRSSVGGSIVPNRADDNPDDYEMYSDIFRPAVHDSGFPGVVAASSMAGSSPQMQHVHYEQQPYDDHEQQMTPSQQQHVSLSATSTVPDYGQYRQQGQERWVDDGYGYDAVVNEAIIGSSGGPYYPPTYASQDNGGPNDHFLRELRELSNTYNSTVGGAKQTVGNALGNEHLAGTGAQQKAQAEAKQSAQNAQTHAEGFGDNVKGAAQKAVGGVTNDHSMEARGHGNSALGDVKRNV